MHLVDLSCGFKGTTPIVANSIPVGVGIGLSLQLDGGDRVSVVYLGDGAVEEGAFYESANFAALRRLPVLFLCENNLYSVYSPLEVRQPPRRRIFEMVEAMGISSRHCDGNDVEAAYVAIGAAVDEIRGGGGPRFLELATYRWREHCGPNYDDELGYRSEAEFLAWKERDPIPAQQARLLDARLVSEQDLQSMDERVGEEVEEAFRFAEASPFPAEEEAFQHVYSTPQSAR